MESHLKWQAEGLYFIQSVLEGWEQKTTQSKLGFKSFSKPAQG